MRPIHLLPLFAAGFALGFSAFGTVLLVKARVQKALPVSTTTLTSASSEKSDALADVRAKAPKNAETTLDFELARTPLGHDNLTATFVRPVGWKASQEWHPEKVKPPGKKIGETGWLTHLEVGTDCAGTCAPKDWAPIIAEKSKLAVPDGPAIHEVRTADGRFVRWNIKGDSAYVYAAWFLPGEGRMYTCTAWLDEKALVPWLDAFVEICKTAKVEG